jgi:hypothetical protein
MQNYKVAVTHESGEDAVHVAATTREHALYKAFDELHDRGYVVATMGDVHMFDDATETWHLIPDHRTLSKATA